jgi:ribosomal-protein-alanine N-acetyltransferase
MSMLSRLLHRADGSSPLAVEPMRRRDLGAVMAIEQVSYPRPWTVGVFQSEIDLARRGDRHYVVARLGGELVG